MHGRYTLAVLLAVVGIAAGGYWGYTRKNPLYESTGLIRVEAVLPRVLYYTEKSNIMPMYDRFLMTQMQTIRTPRLLELALKQPPWRSLERPDNPGMQVVFGRSMSIENPAGTDLIEIKFLDESARGAVAGVRSVIQAYLAMQHEQEAKEESMRIQVLVERRDELATQLADIRKKVADIADKYGTDSLEEVHQLKLVRLDKLETMLRETQWMLATVESEVHSNKDVVPVRLMTPEQIAEVDETMGKYLDERRAIEQELRELRIHRVPTHPTVVAAQKRLEAFNKSIEDYAQQYRASQPENAVKRPWESDGIPTVVTLDQLKAREARLQDLYKPAEDEVTTIGRDSLALRNFQAEANEIEKKLEETRTRIEQLAVEATVSGRVSVVSDGQTPPMPSQDPRKKNAIQGAGLGGMLGLSLVLGLSFIDRRIRRVDDVRNRMSTLPILGILPSLPDKDTDPQEAAVAVHCIHQLRTRLQVTHDHTRRQVFSVTSPISGDGKTSLALALGLSFAESGATTLLVDFDVVGGGLSRRLNPMIRPMLGQLLVKQGVLSNQQLEDALRLSRGADQRLGRMLVTLGYLSDAQLDAVLMEQSQPTAGLLDVLFGLPLGTSIQETTIKNLHVLPRGQAGAQHVGHFSPGFVRSLLEQARQKFDVVLIDTGPTPGSLEASLVAPQADAVVMIVAKGTSGPHAEKAVAHLQSLGANLSGVVFNRAGVRDVELYSQTSSRSTMVSGHSRLLVTTPSLMDEETGFEDFDPVANAVARSTVYHGRFGSKASANVNGSQTPPANGSTHTNGHTHAKSNGHANGTPTSANGDDHDTPRTDDDSGYGLVVPDDFDVSAQAQTDSVMKTQTATESPASPVQKGTTPREPEPDDEEDHTVSDIVYRAIHKTDTKPTTDDRAGQTSQPGTLDAGEEHEEREQPEESFGMFRDVVSDIEGLAMALPDDKLADAPAPSPAVPESAPKSAAPVRVVQCHSCGKKLAVKGDVKHKAGRCPQCKASINLTAAAPGAKALVAVTCVNCDGKYAAKRRDDGSVRARCPHCSHRHDSR